VAIDLRIIETLNGGDAVLTGNRVETVTGFESMIYLGLFGGNPEQSTPESRPDGEEAFDYWGNGLLWRETPDIQFNSTLEKALRDNPLTPVGLVAIENAAKKDLEFMSAFAEVSVSGFITAPNRLRLEISVDEPDNLDSEVYVYLWDGVKQTLTAE
jgi:phage gp46-like protein